MTSNCPLEKAVASALTDCGIRYKGENGMSERLDFYLPASGVFIEVKRMQTDRSNEQLKRAENIILLQGPKAVEMFCRALRGRYK